MIKAVVNSVPLVVALCLLSSVAFGEGDPGMIVPAIKSGKPVDEATMQRVYDETKTPFKYGIVIRGENGKMVDCPSIFRQANNWYMFYICMDDVGYKTYLAQSTNLLQWKTLGVILSFPESGWDKWQASGGPALVDPTWGGSAEIQKFDGKYWLSYIGGAKKGYETDPLAIGIAWTRDATSPVEWTRIAGNPVLSRDQPGVRAFEKLTLYKSTIIWDKPESLGFPFVMFYNAKAKGGERIGMAVSKDMTHWSRYGANPVIANGQANAYGISGDPQIVKMKDLWVMFYFGAFWKPKGFDTFACSYDLVHWTKWAGPALVAPSEAYDQTYAHKPWLIKHDGVVYHFYCAVGSEGRVLALATSKNLNKN